MPRRREYSTRYTTQNWFFYKKGQSKLKWLEYDTKRLVDFLVKEKIDGRWNRFHITHDSVAHLNTGIWSDFTIDDVAECIGLLKDRFNLFRHICRVRGVQWDKTTNMMHVQPQIWPRLIKVNPMAAAYIEKGEPFYDSMYFLWGDDAEASNSSQAPVQDEPIGAALIEPEEIPCLLTDDELAGEGDMYSEPDSERSSGNSMYGPSSTFRS